MAERRFLARAATSHVQTRVCDACCHSSTILLPLQSSSPIEFHTRFATSRWIGWNVKLPTTRIAKPRRVTRGFVEVALRRASQPSGSSEITVYCRTAELRDRQLVDLYECECALRAFCASRRARIGVGASRRSAYSMVMDIPLKRSFLPVGSLGSLWLRDCADWGEWFRFLPCMLFTQS